MGTPALVLEILSDGTRSKDMIDKLNTYRLSGVREYWIVDPRQGSSWTDGVDGKGLPRT